MGRNPNHSGEILGGPFRIFLIIFFCSGAREKEEASEEVAGGSVLIKNRGRGRVFSEEEAWEGGGRWGNVSGEGGAKYFFSGAEIPTKNFRPRIISRGVYSKAFLNPHCPHTGPLGPPEKLQQTLKKKYIYIYI